MANLDILEIPIEGMDCADCTRHVQRAIAALPGVASVEVFLTSEKARVRLDGELVDLLSIRNAVAQAGYRVGEISPAGSHENLEQPRYRRDLLFLLAGLFGFILFAVIGGELLGLFENLNSLVPWWLGLGLVLVAGFPVFRNVVRAAWKRQVTSHTLMTLGVIAALIVGQWVTALLVVFFMRVGDFVENFTTERARQAVRMLISKTPHTARVVRDGQEVEISAGQVIVDEIVIVRPGEKIPVDGVVVAGQATVNESAITGEAMPIEAGPGRHVYAATIAQLGSLRVRASHTGSNTTYGQIIQLVQEAELNKAPVERIADKFSAYYLPVVGGVAGLTFLVSRDPLATAAVLVVACSCAFALATPIAMLASIGAAAQHGLMVKGGKTLELLARADVFLIDKTGTLTLGTPEILDIIPLDPIHFDQSKLLTLAASAEKYSEHPLGQAVRQAAHTRNLVLDEPEQFTAIPGWGVRAVVGGYVVEVGSEGAQPGDLEALERQNQGDGKTRMVVKIDGQAAGMLTARDILRPEVPEALEALRKLGIREISVLTGDNERSAAELAGRLGVQYRAGLLPKDKIEIVKTYQDRGHVVVMVGDGVNDAPALAQADVGIAMGAAGSDVAIAAAQIALMRGDWRLVPEALRIARRTMRVVKGNIGFTALYNVIGLTLAAFGILPPVLAAAAQSLPDLIILGNSSRLIKPK